jgi:hypothetical protein
MYILQGQQLSAPFPESSSADESLTDYVAPTGTMGVGLLSKALSMLTGIRTVPTDDSLLLVEGLDQDAAAARPLLNIGDLVVEVARRSCSWYKGMTIENMILYLQARAGAALEVGVRTDGTADWFLARRVFVQKREPGFIV